MRNKESHRPDHTRDQLSSLSDRSSAPFAQARLRSPLKSSKDTFILPTGWFVSEEQVKAKMKMTMLMSFNDLYV